MGKLACPYTAQGHQPPATEAALTYGHFHRLNIPGIKKCYAKTHTNQKLRQFCSKLAGNKHSAEGTGNTGTVLSCAPRAKVLATWPLLEPSLTERTFYTEPEAAPCPSTAAIFLTEKTP